MSLAGFLAAKHALFAFGYDSVSPGLLPGRVPKKGGRTNLAASFPDKSDKERRSIEKDFYKHFCSVIVETIYLAGISTEEAKRRTSFINGELLEKYLDRGQSVLVYLGHYGNWEYQTFLTLHYPGIHLINVYRPLTSKAFDRLMFKIRDRFDAELLEKQAVLRKMVSLRQQGQAAVFGMIADQSPSKPLPIGPVESGHFCAYGGGTPGQKQWCCSGLW